MKLSSEEIAQTSKPIVGLKLEDYAIICRTVRDVLADSTSWPSDQRVAEVISDKLTPIIKDIIASERKYSDQLVDRMVAGFKAMLEKYEHRCEISDWFEKIIKQYEGPADDTNK